MEYEIVNDEECFLFIHINCITTYGEHLYLVGNHESIGNWDIKNGVKL